MKSWADLITKPSDVSAKEPRDVNNKELREIYGNRIHIDNPLLDGNPEVETMRASKQQRSMELLLSLFKMILESCLGFPKHVEKEDNELEKEEKEE